MTKPAQDCSLDGLLTNTLQENDMATQDFINHARLVELLSYDSTSGVFTWLGDRGGRQFSGKPAGHLKTNGYTEITVDGWRYLAHRLAWFYENKVWPKFDIDHINGCRSDNRIANLRDVLPTDNLQNSTSSSSNNATGVRGVSRLRNKFRAEIRVRNQRYDLGVFDTLESAAAAYLHSKRTLTGIVAFRD
jgi:hypothetical protein